MEVVEQRKGVIYELLDDLRKALVKLLPNAASQTNAS